MRLLAKDLIVKETSFQPPLVHTPTPLIAVVDDDQDILELVTLHLVKAGMKVRAFMDAEGFYRFLHPSLCSPLCGPLKAMLDVLPILGWIYV